MCCRLHPFLQVSGGYHTLGYKKWTVFLHDAERAGAWVLGPPESDWAAERGLKTVRPPGSAAHTPSMLTGYSGGGRNGPHPNQLVSLPASLTPWELPQALHQLLHS